VNKAHPLTQVVLTIIEVLPNLSLNLDQSRFDSCPVASVGRLQDAVTNLALLEFHNNLFIATHSLLLAPQNPIFQRPLKLTSQNTYNFSYIGWKWNGQAVEKLSEIIIVLRPAAKLVAVGKLFPAEWLTFDVRFYALQNAAHKNTAAYKMLDSA
jgi:hypothetical protein